MPKKALTRDQAVALIVASNLAGSSLRHLRANAQEILRQIQGADFWNVDALKRERQRVAEMEKKRSASRVRVSPLKT